MNSDLRLDPGLFRHPKTRRLRARGGPGAVLALLELWCFAAEHRPSGELSGRDAEALEEVSSWSGRPGELVELLLALGFLDAAEAGYRLHNWAERQPWLVDRPARQAAALAANRVRWAKYGKLPAADAGRMRGGCGADTAGNPRSVSFRTVPDESNARGGARDTYSELAERLRALRLAGLSPDEAHKQARQEVFGSKNGQN